MSIDDVVEKVWPANVALFVWYQYITYQTVRALVLEDQCRSVMQNGKHKLVLGFCTPKPSLLINLRHFILTTQSDHTGLIQNCKIAF